MVSEDMYFRILNQSTIQPTKDFLIPFDLSAISFELRRPEGNL